MYPTYGSFGLYGNTLFGTPYGTLALSVTSPPQSWVEPLTVLQVANKLKLDLPLTDEDTEEITSLISAAREQAEILQGRDLVVKQYDLSLDSWPGYRVELRAPLVSVDLVQYTDSSDVLHTMTEGTNYIVDKQKQPGSIRAPYAGVTWPVFVPRPSSAILIRFTSGMTLDDPFWRDAGARIRIGMQRLIGDWFTNVLPFERGMDASQELPYSVTSNFSYGALPRVK